MHNRNDILRELPWFFGLYFVVVFAGITALAYFGKENLHLYFNNFHTNFFDFFFKYYTDIAVNGTLAFLLIYILWKRTWFYFLLLAIPYLSGSLISTFIKKIFFEHVHRPTYYFQLRNINLHLVEGVKNQIPYTFPSGHSLNAFLFFALLCLLFKHKSLQILFFLMMILVMISRVYLSKHFMLDTIGGSLLGMMIFTFTYYFLQQKDWSFLDRKCTSYIKK